MAGYVDDVAQMAVGSEPKEVGYRLGMAAIQFIVAAKLSGLPISTKAGASTLVASHPSIVQEVLRCVSPLGGCI